MVGYRRPDGVSEQETIVKKSRFIARVVPVASREDVNAAVQQAREDYPDARHHCWAYLLGHPADAAGAGMSDDGEPAGTAGKPILNVLQHGDIGDVLVLVIRYFGGIKLGAGGLVRAYGGATRQALDVAPAKAHVTLHHCTVTADFGTEQALRHFLSGIEGQVLSVNYSDRVEMQLALPAEQRAALVDFCAARSICVEDEDG